MGAFIDGKEIVAIGGLNRDPFNTPASIGRFRRFYVAKRFRRLGIGRLLAEELIEHAKEHFELILLRTDTEEAAEFYTSIGFSPTELYLQSTHILRLKD